MWLFFKLFLYTVLDKMKSSIYLLTIDNWVIDNLLSLHRFSGLLIGKNFLFLEVFYNIVWLSMFLTAPDYFLNTNNFRAVETR